MYNHQYFPNEVSTFQLSDFSESKRTSTSLSLGFFFAKATLFRVALSLSKITFEV